MIRKHLSLLLRLCTVLMVGLAYADCSSTVNLTSILDTLYDDQGDPAIFIRKMFQVYNTGILMLLASVGISGLLYAGALAASEGQGIGKKINGWVAIRTIGGAALLLPFGAKSLSVIHIVVIQIMLQSLNLASTVWEGLLTETSQGSYSVEVNDDDPPSPLVRGALEKDHLYPLVKCILAAAHDLPSNIDGSADATIPIRLKVDTSTFEIVANVYDEALSVSVEKSYCSLDVTAVTNWDKLEGVINDIINKVYHAVTIQEGDYEDTLQTLYNMAPDGDEETYIQKLKTQWRVALSSNSRDEEELDDDLKGALLNELDGVDLNEPMTDQGFITKITGLDDSVANNNPVYILPTDPDNPADPSFAEIQETLAQGLVKAVQGTKGVSYLIDASMKVRYSQALEDTVGSVSTGAALNGSESCSLSWGDIVLKFDTAIDRLINPFLAKQEGEQSIPTWTEKINFTAYSTFNTDPAPTADNLLYLKRYLGIVNSAALPEPSEERYRRKIVTTGLFNLFPSMRRTLPKAVSTDAFSKFSEHLYSRAMTNELIAGNVGGGFSWKKGQKAKGVLCSKGVVSITPFDNLAGGILAGMCASGTMDVNFLENEINKMFARVIKAITGYSGEGGIIGYINAIQARDSLKITNIEPKFYPLTYMRTMGSEMMMAGLDYLLGSAIEYMVMEDKLADMVQAFTGTSAAKNYGTGLLLEGMVQRIHTGAQMMYAKVGLLADVISFLSEIDFYAMSSFASIGSMFAMLFIIWGAFFSIFLPIVPYMIVLFTVIGWLLIFIEALIASPLIALGLSNPSSQQYLGASEPSLMMLLMLFLRPVTILVGLVLAVYLSFIGVYVLNISFMLLVPTLLVNISDTGEFINASGTDYAIFLAALMLYSYIAFIILIQCYSVVGTLPDKISQWVGIGALGGESPMQRVLGIRSSFESGVQGAAQGAAEGVKGSMGNIASLRSAAFDVHAFRALAAEAKSASKESKSISNKKKLIDMGERTKAFSGDNNKNFRNYIVEEEDRINGLPSQGEKDAATKEMNDRLKNILDPHTTESRGTFAQRVVNRSSPSTLPNDLLDAFMSGRHGRSKAMEVLALANNGIDAQELVNRVAQNHPGAEILVAGVTGYSLARGMLADVGRGVLPDFVAKKFGLISSDD